MALPNLHGRAALILGEDDFDVDQIVGVVNVKLTDPAELATHALAWCGDEFKTRQRPGDLIVGGRNFGYGHPHYPTMMAMRHLKMGGVIAEFFSPGYWRGEISKGFPQVACPGILASVQRWDELEVDWHAEIVRNLTRGSEHPFERISRGDMASLEAGGLLAGLKQRQGQATCA